MKEKLDLRFKFKPRLLDHLGLSAYSKYFKAIGELIQNGYDADATEVRVSTDIEEDVINAIQLANTLKIMWYVSDTNRKRIKEGKKILDLGIGINTGNVIYERRLVTKKIEK